MLMVIFLIYHEITTVPLTYAEEVDKVVVVLDGEELTLRDLAFYIAYEEQIVNEQALIYDPENPNNYWNLHTNGAFIRTAARENAIDMMVHDFIYEKYAEEAGITWTEEDETLLQSKKEDFLMDLPDGALENLGVTEEELEDTMHRIGLVEKYLLQLAEENEKNYAVYDVGGAFYYRERDTHSITYMNRVITRIPIGQITLSY